MDEAPSQEAAMHGGASSGAGAPPSPGSQPASAAAASLKSKRRKAESSASSSKPKRKKIRTYCRRKGEIEALMGEKAHLERQMQYFTQRAEVLKQRESLMRRELSNKTLRGALRSQRLMFASSVSVISQLFREKDTGPFDSLTHLGKDPVERHTALLKMKHERVQRAYEFMRERQRFMDTSTEFCDQKKFEATNGDLCSVRFEVAPLPAARSVKTVVDALETFVFNIEISISEVLGDITVRENDDPQRSSSVAQHRLVTTIADMVQMDTNNVAFAEYRPQGPPGSGVNEIGFLICDSVDEDELFPYRPSERVRQDVTVIIMVARRSRIDGEPLIVLSRWWCLRIRRSDIDVPLFVVNRIQTGVEKVGAGMMAAVHRACQVPL